MTGRYTVEFTKDADGSGGKRKVRNVPPLNAGDNVIVGNKSMTVTPKSTLAPTFGENMSMPEGDVFLQSASSTSVIRPVEITAVSNESTSGALVTVKELTNEGVLSENGTSYSNVIAIPYRHMASVGMRGIYFTHSAITNIAASGTSRVSTGFVMLPLTLVGRVE
jgi:hypothetical protein